MQKAKDILMVKTPTPRTPSNDPVVLQLGKAILRTVEIREASYDRAASDAATEAAEAKQAQAEKEGKVWYGYGVDYKQFYTKDLVQSAEEALAEVGLSKEFAMLIYLSLEGWWNDVIDWAAEVTGTELPGDDT